MTWLTPLAGILLAAAVVPPLVLLYFLRLRRRPMPIGSTLLWKQATEDLRANAPFQRLRVSLLLLLQLLALALLAFALAQPQVDAGARRGGRTVILVDNSASMNTVDGPEDRSRLEEARRLARAQVERMFGGGLFGGDPGEVMVIAFNDRAEVRTPFTDSRSQLLAAIDGITPTDGRTTIGEALALARAFTTNVDPDAVDRPVEQPAALELYSDGRIEDLEEHVLRESEFLSYTVVGQAETPNVGIVSVAADRPYDRPGHVQVFAGVANFGTEPVSCDVQLSVDGVARAITPTPVELPPGEVDESSGIFVPGRQQVVFLPFEQTRDALVEVAILRDDAFMEDNAAAMALPPARRLRVALVDAEGFFVRDVLIGLQGSMIDQLDLLTVEEFETLTEEGGVEAYDVVVIDDAVLERLPATGRFLVFGAPPPIEGINEFGTQEGILVRALKSEHPIFRFVDLDDLLVFSMRAIAPASDIEVLAEAAEGPLVVSASRGGRTTLYVTFNPLDTNGPFGRNLVNLVCNAVEHLGNLGEAVATEGLAPGKAISARLGPGARDVEVTLPDGSTEPVTALGSDGVSWGPVRRVGIYRLDWRDGAGEQERLFAVNLLSEAESRVEAAPDVVFGRDRQIEGERRDDAYQTPLWPWALGACLLVLFVEWWVYRGRAGT